MVAIVRALKPGETIFGGGAGVVTWNSYDKLRRQESQSTESALANAESAEPKDLAVEISKEWLKQNPVQPTREPARPGEELERSLIEMALRSYADELRTAQAPESEVSSTSSTEASQLKNDET